MTELPTLRDRRRAQTEQEITDAALDLFEQRGPEGTRIEDIASAAGVSKRTFFRYFASKEHAALAVDPAEESLIAQGIANLDPERPVMAQLEDVQRQVHDLYGDGTRDSGRRFLRAWRLKKDDPALRAAAAAMCEEFRQRMVARLGEALDADRFEIDMILNLWTSTSTVARLEWAAVRDAGDRTELSEIYERAIALMRTLTADEHRALGARSGRR